MSVLDDMDAILERLPDPATVPARLEVSTVVWDWMRENADSTGGHWLAHDQMFGLPVSHEPEMAPGTWLVLNHVGDELYAGTLTA